MHFRCPRVFQPYVEQVLGTCRCCGAPYVLERDGLHIILTCLGERQSTPHHECPRRTNCAEYVGRCWGWHLPRWRYRRLTARLLRRIGAAIGDARYAYGGALLYHDMQALRDQFAGWNVRPSATNTKIAVQDYRKCGYPHPPWMAQAIAFAPTEALARRLLARVLADHAPPYDPYDLEYARWDRVVEVDADGRPLSDEWDRLLVQEVWGEFADALKRGTPLEDL